MAYIGNIPAEKFTSVDIQNFTVSATANYTLDRPVANENEIELFINNVRQHPGSGKAYTASGTALTLSEATAGTDTMYCVYQGKARQTVTPATSSVTNAMLAGSIDLTSKVTGALPQANIADQAINEAKMQISNAPTNGYMLTAQSGNTGGLTWAEAPSGGLVYVGGATHTSDVSNVTIDNVFTATYRHYLIIGDYTSADNNVEPLFKFRSGGSSGSTLSGAEYNYHFIRMNADSNSLNNHRSQSNTYCSMGANVNNDETRTSMRFSWTVFDPFTSSKRTSVSGTGRMTATDGNSAFLTGSCDYKGSDSVTGIIFYFSSGNLSPAHFKVYGIVNS